MTFLILLGAAVAMVLISAASYHRGYDEGFFVGVNKARKEATHRLQQKTYQRDAHAPWIGPTRK